jgi:ParB family chromosome partitioning protein
MTLIELEEELEKVKKSIEQYESVKKLKPAEKISYKNVKQRENTILSKIEAIKNGNINEDKNVFGNKDIYMDIDINKIRLNPEQPRKKFNEDSLIEMSDSIKKHGVIQPIILVELAGEYIILAGERRYRASIIAEQRTIPAIIKRAPEYQTKDKLSELALIENLIREDMSLVDEAQAIYKLNKIKGNYRSTGEAIGKGKDYISQLVNIVELGENCLEFIDKHNITNKTLLNLIYKDIPIERQFEFIELIPKNSINLKNYEIFKNKFLNQRVQEKDFVGNTDKKFSKEDFNDLKSIKFKTYSNNKLNIELDINNFNLNELDVIKDLIHNKIDN